MSWEKRAGACSLGDMRTVTLMLPRPSSKHLTRSQLRAMGWMRTLSGLGARVLPSALCRSQVRDQHPSSPWLMSYWAGTCHDLHLDPSLYLEAEQVLIKGWVSEFIEVLFTPF